MFQILPEKLTVQRWLKCINNLNILEIPSSAKIIGKIDN